MQAQWLVSPHPLHQHSSLELAPCDDASSLSLCAAKLARMRRNVAGSARAVGTWLAGKAHAAACGMRSGVAACTRKVGKMQAACMSLPPVRQ